MANNQKIQRIFTPSEVSLLTEKMDVSEESISKKKISRNLTIKIPEKTKKENIWEYAERLSEWYTVTCDAQNRKLKGQFFTPNQVSKFMASLFEVKHNTIHLLDPGAGTGVLTAAFCECLLAYSVKNRTLTIDAYENDHNLLPLLDKVLEVCKTKLAEKGCKVEYNIYGQDFILHNVERSKKAISLWVNNRDNTLYDFIICNPPYYKLNKDSSQSTVMSELNSGQPNIYALFMALSASMLKSDGEMVFITPRSFCSGLYYKKFRGWLLNNIQLTNIHIFESRKDIFDKDGVLQENIIIKAKKGKKENKYAKISITNSENKSFKKLRKNKVRYSDVIYHKNGDTFIRIPTSSLDVEILHTLDAWPNTLKDLGLEISTGPVVPFRAEKYLLPEFTKNQDAAPLIWMHNFQDMKVVWPLKKNHKESAIKICRETKSLLLPVKNYVLVKRFSSKEQKRRLYGAVLLESEFPHEIVGLENHVNYIHKLNGNLSLYESLGIAAILNTTIVDNFFRSLNGNTQVNATDIRSLPLPDVQDITEIGKLVYKLLPESNYELDNIVAKKLDIDTKIMKSLNENRIKNG